MTSMIQIEFDELFYGELIFRHSGKPFTADDIRYLIEQISTKDRQQDDQGLRKTTGKFGTGFLSTHLLAETVTVNAVAKEPELDSKKFQLKLDRSGQTLDAIAASVQSANKSIQNLDELPSFLDYDENDLNTAFHYSIKDAVGEEVTRAGILDLQSCLPFALVFVSEIEQVELVNEGLTYSRLSDEDGFACVEISSSSDDSRTDEFRIATEFNGLTRVAIPVKMIDGIVHIGEVT